MKKKILTKHILMALAMVAMVPAGQAWAWEVIEDGNTLVSSSDKNETLNLTDASPVTNTSLAQFTTIQINHKANQSQRDFAAMINGKDSVVDLKDTNFKITVDKNGENENADGLHITGNNTKVTIGDFSGAIYAANSDGISIGNESGGSNILNVRSIGQNDINGDSIADGLIVDNGNGIRASAVSDKYVSDKTFTGYESVINVAGATNITINGGLIKVTQDVSEYIPDSLKNMITSATANATYTPAAVYAGDDMYNFKCNWYDLAEKSGKLELLNNNLILKLIVVAALDTMGTTEMGNNSIGTGIIHLNGTTNLTLNGEGNYGILAGKNGKITIDGNLTITAFRDNSYGIAAKNGNLIYGDGEKNVTATAQLGGALANAFGDSMSAEVPINMDLSQNKGTSVLLGEGINVGITMHGDNSYAMYAEGVDDTEDNNANSITGKKLNTLYAVGDMLVENGGSIDLGTTGEKTDNNGNSWGSYQLGAVIASGTNTTGMKSTYSLNSANANYVSSESVIADAGDLNTSTDDQFKDKRVISALYADDDAAITVSGQSNTFLTKADSDQLERVIWAYNGADITVDGTTTISTDSYEKSANSNDIAIAAGTAVGLTSKNDIQNIPDNAKAHVNLNYGAGSSITGDILAGYAGEVNIDRQDAADDAGIRVVGNLLAGNNGILNVDLGNGGELEGRADDYGDAGVVTTNGYTENSFRHPAFSSGIYKGGAVNLTMGAGSTWNVTGQSWITRINTENAGKTADVLNAADPISAMNDMATIDLVHSNTDYNATAHALTIYEMNGDAVFKMSLDGDRDVSDMLYMKTAEGNYIVNLQDAVEINDMYHDPTSNIEFDGLRFATVGAGSNVSFRVFAKGQGMQNIEYTVESKNYDSAYDAENDAYNSTDKDIAENEQKPGSALVENFFASKGEPPADSESNGQASADTQIMLLNATDTNTAGESTENGGAENIDLDATTNFRLVGIKNTTLSNAGQTVIDMSKVNYSNAVYMDRLNKRMGEARYIDGDDGLWVRLRHDRIGKEDAFRSMNTMFELGYDRKVQDQKDGEHRRGVAFDYMRGEADYTNVMGSGDVRRAGVWLYDTWLGDKGHYSDYVVKYGRLSNDFDIFSESGDKISGDYDNDVWSASAEYGRKKDIGNEWYFEPQAQLQYAYVTSAEYTTSQNTKVSLDGIDSLIGRAGFRLGRDTSEGNTVYFKADILHEFLGDQSIHAMDTTTNGVLSTTYENEGTWYDVGFGFSHRMGEDSYMFLDVEHSFGNDNEDTYQINIGLNRAF